MQFLTDLLQLISTMPGSTILIMLVSIGLSLISIWATRRFTDMEKMQQDMEDIKEWQERLKRARQSMDPIELQQVQEDQGRILRLQGSMMTSRMKPMCVFYLPLIIVFYIMNTIYGGSIVAVIPFNIQDVLPFLTGMIGAPTSAGFGLSFYGYYFLVGFGLGNLIRRPFGLTMTA